MLYLYYFLLTLTLLAAVSMIYHSLRNGITPMPSSRRAAELMVKCAAEEAALIVAGAQHRSAAGAGTATAKGTATTAAKTAAAAAAASTTAAATAATSKATAAATAATAAAGKKVRIIEAGSGWGGLAIALARRIPGAQVVGYENSPLPFLCSALRARITGCPWVQFRFSDYRKIDLAEADIIVAYLFPQGMSDLARLLTSASAKSRPPTLISNTFALPGIQPKRRLQSGDASLSTVYVYRSAGGMIKTNRM